MIREKCLAIKEELLSYSRAEKLFIVFAMLCGFCITSEYAVTKVAANSIFITAFGVKFFPYAWLAVVPLNLLIVYLYNRFVPKIGCLRMLIFTTLITATINVFGAFFAKDVKFLPFLLYVWKDIYILLMLQQLWSVIHAKIPLKKAKYLYGIIFGVGGLGSVFGSLLPGLFAVRFGSEHLLLYTVPIYAILIVFYHYALKYADLGKGSEIFNAMRINTGKATQGLQLIKRSRNLKFILLIVIFMQVTSTLIDFQFNAHLEIRFPDQDLRSQFYGRLFSIINFGNLFLQFVGSYLLVELLGLRKSHFLLPAILCINAIGSLCFPLFGVIAYSFAVIKAFDYSVFGIIKEMLYIPLKVDEKFKAKSIIDIFSYRTSKAFASFLIISISSLSLLRFCPLILFLMWLLAVVFLFRTSEAPEKITTLG